jgi:LPS-assembly protein
MTESLGGSNSDRYTYMLPKYNFSKNFFLEEANGSFNFSSSGNHTINNTNVSSSTVSNNLNFASFEFYSDLGITTDYEVVTKNLNSMSDKSIKYKNSPQSEFMSSYFYNVSLPLQKITEDRQNTLTPKLNIRFNPHEMKNHANTSRRISIGNVFSSSRLDMGDSYEAGESFTLGLDFNKKKVNQVSKVVEIDGVSIDYENLTDDEIEKKLKRASNFKKEIVEEIEEYFDFKLATVFRFNKEENIPINSTLNEKSSNVLGIVNYKPIKDLKLTYEFSLTNDFNTIEYNSIGAEYISDHFYSKFTFLEETGILGDSNVINYETKLIDFKDYHNLSFSTRRNRKLNLTEYYDILYEYKNDCLTAGIKYRKDYYTDSDIIPKEELFFSLTIVPFYTFSPNKMILKKDGGTKERD